MTKIIGDVLRTRATRSPNRANLRCLGLAAGIAIAATGCTDAQRAKIGGLGDPARITCYSGGRVVYDDFSTGKVSPEGGGAGYYFRSQSTGKLIEMTGDCRVIYDEQKPAGFKAVL